jgi:hypothetical protein
MNSFAPNIRVLCMYFGSFILVVSFSFNHAVGISDQRVQSRYLSLNAAAHKRNGLGDTAFGNAIALQYTSLFSSLQLPSSLARQSPDDAELLFRAANIAEFYSHKNRFIGDMSADLDNLERAGKAANADYADMYRALIDVRDFDGARRFLAAHPEHALNPLPPVENDSTSHADQPSVLAIDVSHHALIHRTTHLTDSAYIIVAGHPNCHWSRNAVHDLEANAAMQDLFRDHAHWITPQDGHVADDFGTFVEWDRRHPAFKMSFAYKQSEWPLVSSWSTPTFYFIKDGKVAAKVVGWPDQGNIQALTKAARKIGLIK